MQRIRIKVKGYDHKVVDNATKQIIDTASRTGAKVYGPIPLPTRGKIFVVNESPHVDSKSKEHFKISTHMRLVDVEPTSQTVEALTHLQLAAGVWIEIK